MDRPGNDSLFLFISLLMLVGGGGGVGFGKRLVGHMQSG